MVIRFLVVLCVVLPLFARCFCGVHSGIFFAFNGARLSGKCFKVVLFQGVITVASFGMEFVGVST